MGYIYKTTNRVTGDFYIGQTTKSFKWRLQDSYRESKRPSRRKTKFLKAIAEYGIENFYTELIEEVDNKLLNEKEIHYIALLNPTYNMSKGGSGRGGIPVYQYELDGTFVSQHKTMTEATLAIGAKHVTNIIKCATGVTKTGYGYRWEKQYSERLDPI